VPTVVAKLESRDGGVSLVLTPEMLERLGVTDQVDVRIEADRIILRKPMAFDEARARSHARYANA
jgi:hypothetical protein